MSMAPHVSPPRAPPLSAWYRTVTTRRFIFRYKCAILRTRERPPTFRMKPLIIGIAGGTGSGKSTVARNVMAALSASDLAFIEMDAYYWDLARMPVDERKRANFDHPGAFDLDLLVHHLEALSAGRSIDMPVYDFRTHTRSSAVARVTPGEVVVVDGILLLADERLRRFLDVKVFVDADADIRLVRRIRRDMASRGRPLDEILDQYLTTVQPMHLQFVEPSKRYADIIVPRGGHNTVAVEMIVAKIQARLARVVA